MEVMNEPLVYLVIEVLDIHHLALSQFMACHRIFNKSNMTGATTRAGIITPFGETVFISGFCEDRVVHFVQLHVFAYFYSVL
jgi:hypothetical protein